MFQFFFFGIANLKCLTNNGAVFARKIQFSVGRECRFFVRSRVSVNGYLSCQSHDRHPFTENGQIANPMVLCGAVLLFWILFVGFATEVLSEKFELSELFDEKSVLGSKDRFIY